MQNMQRFKYHKPNKFPDNEQTLIIFFSIMIITIILIKIFKN